MSITLLLSYWLVKARSELSLRITGSQTPMTRSHLWYQWSEDLISWICNLLSIGCLWKHEILPIDHALWCRIMRMSTLAIWICLGHNGSLLLLQKGNLLFNVSLLRVMIDINIIVRLHHKILGIIHMLDFIVKGYSWRSIQVCIKFCIICHLNWLSLLG